MAVCRHETLEPDAVVAADRAASIPLSENDSVHHATSFIMGRQRGTGARRERMEHDGHPLEDNALASFILQAYHKRDSMRCTADVRAHDLNNQQFRHPWVSNGFAHGRPMGDSRQTYGVAMEAHGRPMEDPWKIHESPRNTHGSPMHDQ